MALALMMGLRLFFDHGETAAIDATAMLLGKSKNTLWPLLRHWQEHKEVLVLSTAHRGAGSPSHRYHDSQLEMHHIATIHRTIVEANEEGPGCTTQMILNALLREHAGLARQE